MSTENQTSISNKLANLIKSSSNNQVPIQIQPQIITSVTKISSSVSDLNKALNNSLFKKNKFLT